MSVDKLTSADIISIGIQDDVDSYPHRTNYENLKNNLNELNDEIAAAAIGTTNAETTAARPYHDSLKNRLDDMWNNQANYIVDGGVVSVSSAGNTVDVTTGKAKVDGIDCKWDAATSGAISYTGSDTRFDIVVVNSDSSISVVTGVASADPVYPAIAITQKPLAILTVSTTDITATDARNQGCWYHDDGYFSKFKFLIQDAIDDISSGKIFIGKGIYYEEVNLTGKSNIELIGERGSKIYRKSDTNYAIRIDEDSTGVTTDNKLVNLQLYGNGKAGDYQLLFADYSDRLAIYNCYFDGNASSTSTYKNFTLDNCDDLSMSGNIAADNTYRVTSCTSKHLRGRVQSFTANGTWRCSLGATEVLATVIAGGGGGGSGCNGAPAGGAGGGGAGQYISKLVAVSDDVTVTVGGGGTGGAIVGGGAGNDGADGSASSFGSFSAAGGNKGQGGQIGVGGNGGAGVGYGSGSAGAGGNEAVGGNGGYGAGAGGGDEDNNGGVGGTGINYAGGAIGISQTVGANEAGGGGGGAGGYGGAGGRGGDTHGGTGATAGGVGVGYGAGGGGGSGGNGSGGNNGTAGGDGADGLVVVQWQEFNF